MNKKQMSETEICTNFITPALEKSSWTKKQVRMNVYFTDGRIIVAGKTVKRGKRNFADYVLEYKPNVPLAVIEAKDNNYSIGDGMQQGLGYAEKLDLPFVFSSNGDGFVFHDRETGKEINLSLDKFPTPKELWEKYKKYKCITEKIEDTVTSDYFYEPGFKQPRYYQRIAINRTIEAVAKGIKRALLVMATGTGKTYVAFQTIWRLREAGLAKRVLYLADRNILIDQPKNNDLKPLSKIITKISNRKADPSYEVYLALYQAVSGEEDIKNIYKQFSPEFFDLIIVDECHRGSAKADSQWREILDYFKPAVQVGMTATPKETKDTSNIDYFGKPLYTYSLREGIEDGFLAPYKVVKVAIDKDVHGYRPKKGETDKFGHEIPDFIYTNREFDKTLVIDERTEVVAKKITEFLKNTDRFSKTIVFCVDIEHAERMRQALINENSDLYKENSKYIMRITGDNNIGKKQLGNFIDPAEKYPVIVTTSKLMNTGVDAQTCKLIVLDSRIDSMTEFKQIIGRGTRIKEDYGKHFFTIMDFRNVTNKFADPDFDGEPVQIYTIKEDQEVTEQETKDQKLEDGERILVSPSIAYSEEEEKVRKFYVRSAEVKVINERVQYHDPQGKLITESLTDYTKKNVSREFRSLNEFIQKWNIVDQKKAIIEELENQGLLLDALREEIPNGKEYDPFDLIAHIAYGQKPLTRSQRSLKVQKDAYFNKYGEKARKVIEVLLTKYEDEGIEEMENSEILKVSPINKLGRPLEIMKLFGGVVGYKKMIKEIEMRLYK
ncbi:MAG: DEAD/DEAH box helicase family protein [Candidatus Nanoarchaeia archaeon]|nr:DEAD/DEAH box helicase family protein [Candidatus Nanoarchaeia archaeon]